MSAIFDAAAFGAAHIAALALFLFCCYLWGGFVLESLIPNHESERLFTNTVAGLGLLIVFLFYAAVASMLYTSVVICFLCIAPAYFVYRKNFEIITFGTSWTNRAKILGTCLLVSLLLAPFMLPPLFPPTMWDEISYHLPYARFYVENHGLGVNPFLRYPLYSHNIDLLYSLSLLFYDDILAHLFHAAAAVLTASGVYYLGKETHSRAAGILASSIFLSSGVVLEMMRTAYIDLGLTLFVFFAFFCISKWLLSRNESWLYIAGFATGIALGCKYSGFLYLTIFMLWILVEGKGARPLLRYFAIALIFGSPWYIRNILLSGDPLSPFGGKIFGYWLWNQQDLIVQGRDLLVKHGSERTILSFLKLPWNVVFHPELFENEQLSPGVLALYPTFIIFRWMTPFYRKVALFVLLHIALWFSSTQIVRYLLPILPMIALISSVCIMKVFEVTAMPAVLAVSRLKGLAPVHRAATLLPVVLAAVPLFIIDVGTIKYVAENPVPVTKASRDQYLSMRVPGYELLQVANKYPHLPIYQMGFEDEFYYAKGMMKGDWFGPARYSGVNDCLSDPCRLHATLKAQDVKLFLINKDRFSYDPQLPWAQYTTKICENEHGALLVLK